MLGNSKLINIIQFLKTKLKQKLPRLAAMHLAWRDTGRKMQIPQQEQQQVTIFSYDTSLAEDFNRVKPSCMNYYGNPCSVRKHMQEIWVSSSIHNAQKFAVMAHWDPHNRIDPYVKHYLSALKKMGFATIIASQIEVIVENDAEDYLDAAIWRTCSGYDFTSWKGALEYFPKILDSKELLLCNDSVFGPIKPLEPIHLSMEELNCDFWGMGESNKHRTPHLFSFYLVFKQSALRHDAFKNFWRRVDTNPDKTRVVTLYEIQLSMQLMGQGLRGGTFFSYRDIPFLDETTYIYTHWRYLLNHAGFPFLKRDLVIPNRHPEAYPIEGWEDELTASGYPAQLVINYFSRIQSNELFYPELKRMTDS